MNASSYLPNEAKFYIMEESIGKLAQIRWVLGIATSNAS
jgi:hypothetical protein